MMTAKEEIIELWQERIFKDGEQVPVAHLQGAAVPEAFHAAFLGMSEKILESEMNRILESPFIQTGDDSDKASFEALKGWLRNRIALPANSVNGAVGEILDRLFQQWDTQPLSLTEALEHPEVMAQEVFRRAASISPRVPEDGNMPAEFVASVCGVSGISVLDKVTITEKELGSDELSEAEFARMVQRFLLLKERYHIGRWRGRESNLEQIRELPLDGTTAGKAESESTVTADVSEVEHVENVDVAEAERETLDTELRETALEEPVREVESVEPAAVTADSQVVLPGDGDQETVSVKRPAAVEIPEEVLEQNESLYRKLMDPEIKEDFVRAFFKYEPPHVYAEMVLQICRQKGWSAAGIVADNALFLAEASPGTAPAKKLFGMIRGHFEP